MFRQPTFLEVRVQNQLAQKQEAALTELSEEAKQKNISLSLTLQGDYQMVALNELTELMDREERMRYGK